MTQRIFFKNKMVFNSKKCINVTCNILNLPYTVKQCDLDYPQATYAYLADGTKLFALSTKVTFIPFNIQLNGFVYFGSLVYKVDNSGFDLESTSFGGGRINTTNSGYDINYFITDHLGSTRAATGSGGGMVHYYPFGKTWEGLSTPAAQTRYLFNGKEKQTVIAGFNGLDYGARVYDEFICRWLTQDPLQEQFYGWSSYNYCMNNPIGAIDFEGKLVIFINGMYWLPGQGKEKYWKSYNDFDKKVMNHLKDHNSMYIDGSIGGVSTLLLGIFDSNISASARENHGKRQGKFEAPNIINRITDENGNIKETIKIITHSMGAAYAKGYVKALVDYMIKNNIPLSAIAFEADFAPYQPTHQEAVPGVDTYQFTNFYDGTASSSWLFSPYGYIKGARFINTDFDRNKGHSLTDFEQQILSLPAGRYRIENGQIVPY